MATRRYCDLCKKEVNRKNKPFVSFGLSDLPYDEICYPCWQNQKNWPKIHAIQKDK